MSDMLWNLEYISEPRPGFLPSLSVYSSERESDPKI